MSESSRQIPEGKSGPPEEENPPFDPYNFLLSHDATKRIGAMKMTDASGSMNSPVVPSWDDISKDIHNQEGKYWEGLSRMSPETTALLMKLREHGLLPHNEEGE